MALRQSLTAEVLPTVTSAASWCGASMKLASTSLHPIDPSHSSPHATSTLCAMRRPKHLRSPLPDEYEWLPCAPIHHEPEGKLPASPRQMLSAAPHRAAGCHSPAWPKRAWQKCVRLRGSQPRPCASSLQRPPC